MKILILTLLTFILSCHSNTSEAQNLTKNQNEQWNKLDDYIKDEMKKRQIPGLALGICKGDSLVRVSSYGYADLQNLAPVRSTTVFELASITKQFTAGAIMLLKQDGKLKLEDFISNYIKDCPEAWKDITIKHLLTHTSGLPAMGKGFTGLHSFTPQELWQILNYSNFSKEHYFKLIKTDILDFKAGDKFSYSDTGYFLLGYIIDTISGSYRNFIKKRIFDRLGMTSSYILDQISVHKFEARGYTLRDGKLVNIRRIYDHEIPAHYGIFSNVADLQKWDAALNSNSFFTTENKHLMWKNTKLNNGKYTGYGLGWYTKKVTKNRVVSHTGATGAEIIKFVDEKVTIILLTNLGVGIYDPVYPCFGVEIAKFLEYNP